jgi:hypothetical protein
MGPLPGTWWVCVCVRVRVCVCACVCVCLLQRATQTNVVVSTANNNTRAEALFLVLIIHSAWSSILNLFLLLCFVYGPSHLWLSYRNLWRVCKWEIENSQTHSSPWQQIFTEPYCVPGIILGAKDRWNNKTEPQSAFVAPICYRVGGRQAMCRWP